MQAQPVSAWPESGPVRILIAAAQSSFRELLRVQLESEPQVQVVGDAPDVRLAYSLTRRLKPDILLIECGLNRELSARYSLRSNSPKPMAGIVVILETPRIQDILEAFELGAKGVVMRASLPRVWRTGIQSIIAGQYWVEDRSVALLLDAVRDLLGRSETRPLPQFGLTTREIEIAGRIAAGRSNKDVGREFSICERTVKHHLTNIFKKVGVSSRLELAVLMRDTLERRTSSPNSPDPSDQRQKRAGEPYLYVVTENSR